MYNSARIFRHFYVIEEYAPIITNRYVTMEWVDFPRSLTDLQENDLIINIIIYRPYRYEYLFYKAVWIQLVSVVCQQFQIRVGGILIHNIPRTVGVNFISFDWKSIKKESRIKQAMRGIWLPHSAASMSPILQLLFLRSPNWTL